MHNANHKQRREVQNFELVTCARLELHLISTCSYKSSWQSLTTNAKKY